MMSADLASKYEIRQLVYTINRNWFHTIFSTGSKRVARQTYEQICKNNPDGYFELVEIQHSEQCLAVNAGNR